MIKKRIFYEKNAPQDRLFAYGEFLLHKKSEGIRHIGERMIRGCASAVFRDCNMIELVHAKLTHTYAATRRPSGMHVGCASVMLSVFQFFRFV